MIETGEQLQEGMPMARIPKGTKVYGRVIEKRDGKLFVTLRSGSLERPFRRLDRKERNEEACQGIPADEWLEGEVYNMMFGTGAFVRVVAPGHSKPSGGLLRVEQFADGLEDDIVLGTKVRVRVINCEPELGRLEFSMQEPTSEVRRTPVESLEIGQEVEGTTVRLIRDVGILIDIGAERTAVIETGELQVGMPLLWPPQGTQVKGRIIEKRDGKIFVTCRPGGLERPSVVRWDPREHSNVAACRKVPASTRLEGEVCALVVDKGAIVRVTAPYDDTPSLGVLRVRDMADKLKDTIAVGDKFQVRVLYCNPRDGMDGLLYFTMKEHLRSARDIERDIESLELGLGTASGDGQHRMPAASFVVGQEVEGTVESHVSFGTLIDIGAEELALVETGGVMVRLGEKTRVQGRVVGRKGRKILVSLRTGSLEQPPRSQDAPVF